MNQADQIKKLNQTIKSLRRKLKQIEAESLQWQNANGKLSGRNSHLESQVVYLTHQNKLLQEELNNSQA